MSKEFKARLGFLFAQAAHVFRLETSKAIQCHELSPRTIAILEILATRQGLTQQEISCALNFDRTSMVMLVDELEEKGFVVREKHPHDRRCHALVLTAKGREAQEKIAQAAEMADQKVLAPLNQAERSTLKICLEKILAQSSREEE